MSAGHIRGGWLSLAFMPDLIMDLIMLVLHLEIFVHFVVLVHLKVLVHFIVFVLVLILKPGFLEFFILFGRLYFIRSLCHGVVGDACHQYPCYQYYRSEIFHTKVICR